MWSQVRGSRERTEWIESITFHRKAKWSFRCVPENMTKYRTQRSKQMFSYNQFGSNWLNLNVILLFVSFVWQTTWRHSEGKRTHAFDCSIFSFSPENANCAQSNQTQCAHSRSRSMTTIVALREKNERTKKKNAKEKDGRDKWSRSKPSSDAKWSRKKCRHLSIWFLRTRTSSSTQIAIFDGKKMCGNANVHEQRRQHTSNGRQLSSWNFCARSNERVFGEQFEHRKQQNLLPKMFSFLCFFFPFRLGIDRRQKFEDGKEYFWVWILDWFASFEFAAEAVFVFDVFSDHRIHSFEAKRCRKRKRRQRSKFIEETMLLKRMTKKR